MLFKTISASVYGIDAYLVEVEVDVGSARMQDFNVVGLPDNAVKESRKRIKSALRNCGFEFPYGQGVTINLAPADVRKEGSGFDLPMALGLAWAAGRQARSRSFLCWWPQHSIYRSTRRRQNHAGQAHPHNTAADVAGRSHRNHARPQRRRTASIFISKCPRSNIGSCEHQH
jgi:hypothetical protein